MHKPLALAAIAFAVSLLPAHAHAQMGVASSEQIGAAVSACMQAASTSGIDTGKLVAAGWAPAPLEAEGKRVETPLRFYSKADSSALILASTQAKASCIVMARIASFDLYAATAEGISRTLQSKPIQQKGNEFFWSSGSHIIQLAATGSREKPSIRAGVIAMQEEKK